MGTGRQRTCETSERGRKDKGSRHKICETWTQRGGDALSLETVKVRLDQGSEHLMELSVSLFTAEELHQTALKGPFLFKQFCDSNTEMGEEMVWFRHS